MSKPKIALCLSGAIGYNDGNMLEMNRIYRSRNYVDYKKCANNTLKFMIEPNREKYDIDIFCHCWTTDLEQELISLYSPKKALFEDNTQYKTLISGLCTNTSDFSGISKTLSIKKSVELKEAYEAENNMMYTSVIIYRYDCLLWKPLVLEAYTGLDDIVYVNAGANGNGDFHFVMANAVSAIFKNLIDSIALGNRYIVHSWIKNYVVNYMKYKIKEDEIRAGVHQEVIRKVGEYSIGRGHLTIQQYREL